MGLNIKLAFALSFDTKNGLYRGLKSNGTKTYAKAENY